MSFTPAEHPRTTDGKFAEKVGAAVEISLSESPRAVDGDRPQAPDLTLAHTAEDDRARATREAIENVRAVAQERYPDAEVLTLSLMPEGRLKATHLTGADDLMYWNSGASDFPELQDAVEQLPIEAAHGHRGNNVFYTELDAEGSAYKAKRAALAVAIADAEAAERELVKGKARELAPYGAVAVEVRAGARVPVVFYDANDEELVDVEAENALATYLERNVGDAWLTNAGRSKTAL